MGCKADAKRLNKLTTQNEKLEAKIEKQMTKSVRSPYEFIECPYCHLFVCQEQTKGLMITHIV